MAGSGRAAVRMSPDEVEEFLGSQMKVQVATVNPDGSPHLTTLFYVVDDGRIAFWTYASSQKIKNLERDARITCLVEAGRSRATSSSPTAPIPDRTSIPSTTPKRFPPCTRCRSGCTTCSWTQSIRTGSSSSRCS